MHNHHKKIHFLGWAIVVLVILFILGVLWGERLRSPMGARGPSSAENGLESDERGDGASQTLEVKANSKEKALEVFKNFLERAKTHDIEGVESLAYKQSEACADPTRRDECFKIMDSVVEFGKEVREEDYVHVWEDESQIILSTNPRRDKFGESEGYLRGYIYFVRDDYTGSIKILTIDPNRGWFYKPQPTDTAEFVEKKLQDTIRDSDKDGLVDFQESCVGSYYGDPDCTNTNPNERDTDKDGWWDGVEYYFRKS